MSHPVIYSIKRHGTSIAECDKEPVQTPGCIQPHGVLMVLRRVDLTILQVSENSADWLGLGPEKLNGQKATALWAHGDIEKLRRFISEGALERNPFFVFSFLPPAAGRPLWLDVTVHTLEGLLVAELEPSSRGTGEGSAPDYYSLLKKTLARFQAAPTLRDLCQTVAAEVRVLSGLDRVMIYRFHADDSGEVFAESRRPDLQSWEGWRYPAHDIPKPAREIFKRIWIRPVPNIKAPLAELVPLANPDTGGPLEMTHCSLRGASVMYTEYLANMGVGAALTMSLMRNGELWGLIACHHYTPIHFPYQLRAACEFLAQNASLQLLRAEDREDDEYRRAIDAAHYAILSRAATQSNLSPLVLGSPNLRNGIRCDGVAVLHRGEWWTDGRTPTIPQMKALVDWLRATGSEGDFSRAVFETDMLAQKYAPAAEFASVGSGLLAVRIDAAASGAVLWFRVETIQTFTWGGNPHELPLVAGPNGPRLTPRKSFELWEETVRNRSLPWRSVERAAAARLRQLLLDLVVTRLEELAALNAELQRSNAELDAFAALVSHDLKEPLRGIRKYARQLGSEPSLAQAAADVRERPEAIARLVGRMEGLIQSILRYSRLGRAALELETLDLNAIVKEALEMLGARAYEQHVRIEIPRPLPRWRCDQVRCREIWANLISNALKYCDKPQCRVEIGYVAPKESVAFLDRSRAPESARAETVFYVRDNGCGIDPQFSERVFRMFKRLPDTCDKVEGSGVGLAVVKKMVEQHRGVVWFDSVPGQGADFFFTLPAEEEHLT